MIDLFAERFVGGTTAGKPWLDLATGAEVHVRIAGAGNRQEQLAWNDCCAEVARLRHPAFNELLDFGAIGSSRTFEAYAVAPAVRTASAVSSRLVAHARAFLESRRVRLPREVAACLIREKAPPRCRAWRSAIGVVLQPRVALAAVEEALDGTAPGTISISLVGPRGCGLRTLRTLVARSARLAGYVPVASRVLARLQWLHERIEHTHVCVLLDEASSTREREHVAQVTARLGSASARRHVIVTFARAPDRAIGAIEVDPMSVNTLRGMVFLESGAARLEEVWAAARDAGGVPGLFLERLGAARLAAPHRFALSRESSPAYVVRAPARAALSKTSCGRILRDAPERGAKLARRGRHAAAIRLLTRAARVLEARGDRNLSAACTEQLGWIERARGRSDRALDAFQRTRVLGNDGAIGVCGALGTGIVWTDERRFDEAEAVLRGAQAGAALLGNAELEHRARRALARCLCWQRRYSDAAATLGKDDEHVEVFALKSRVALASDEIRAASIAAMTAWDLATRSDDLRLVAVAARSMALVHAAIGNQEQVVRWVAQGTRAAAAEHLPLVGLRLRAIAGAAHARSALRHRQVPPLVRDELESALVAARAASRPRDEAVVQDRTLRDLHELLSTVHGASDDGAGLEALCRVVAERTRAATVQIIACPRVPRMLARAGRPWQGDISCADRVLAGGAPVSIASSDDLRHAAEPISYGQEVVAVLCCRWPAGVEIDRPGASSRIKAAALAAAAAVRALLDRSDAPLTEAVAGELVGTSPAAAALRDAIARAARSPFPILVEGESGSGKELVARGIHRLGVRRDRRLCTVNCAALTDELLESELFGHSRGAFTGAIAERAGLFEDADGGTLFLDEVGELSARAQAKLLRVLQDGEVRRVGENLPRRVDTRIIAATNRRLDEEVAAQRFRADLRFRLDVVRIVVPPLRERATDVPALALHFWSEAVARVGSSASLAPDTLAALSRYDWPGNVRELQNAIAALAVHAPRRSRVTPVMLPAHIAGAVKPGGTSFDAARQEFERRYVRAALAQAAGHRSRAARALGVSRQGLAKMLRRLGIDG